MARFFRNYFFQVTSLKDRFRKNDEPSEGVFRKLFDSIPFFKESESTASTTDQGLVRLADDGASSNRNSTKDADGFSKVVSPHQLPNLSSGDGIQITPSVSSSGRTGGSGKDFLIENTMVVSSLHLAITVTQVSAGEDVQIDFDETRLSVTPGMIKVSSDDTTPGYVEDKITAGSPNVSLVTGAPAGDERRQIWVKTGKPREVTMWMGSAAQMAVDFPAGYNTTPSSEWYGWAICDGGVYNGIQTRDMRKLVPIGYHAVDYPNINTATYNQDGLGNSGAESVTLAKSQIPPHVHVISADNTHAHTFDSSDAAGTDDMVCRGDIASQTVDLSVDSITDHDHGATTGDGVADGLAVGAHENRMPFATVLFVIYVGV